MYFAILEAGRVYSPSRQPDVADLQDTGVFAPGNTMPLDAFRMLDRVPPGTGYVPHSNEPPDPHEAARVSERRFLIEAKSLTRPFAAIDRMRYGMGQPHRLRGKKRGTSAGPQ